MIVDFQLLELLNRDNFMLAKSWKMLPPCRNWLLHQGNEVSKNNQWQEQPTWYAWDNTSPRVDLYLPILVLGIQEENFFTTVELHYGNTTKSLLISNILWVCLLTGGAPFFSWGMRLPFGFLLHQRWFPGSGSKRFSHCFCWLLNTVVCIGLQGEREEIKMHVRKI